MVYARTRQLAINAGRSSGEITQLDYEQAKRELTGVSDMEQQLEILSGCIPPARTSPDDIRIKYALDLRFTSSPCPAHA